MGADAHVLPGAAESAGDVVVDAADQASSDSLPPRNASYSRRRSRMRALTGCGVAIGEETVPHSRDHVKKA